MNENYSSLFIEHDYYPFGMLMPGRNFSSDNYRYGFNGKETDNEVKGTSAQYDYGFRIYDTRLGKFLSVDPLFQSFPWYTPYQFAGNSPILNIDLDGLENEPSQPNTTSSEPNEVHMGTYWENYWSDITPMVYSGKRSLWDRYGSTALQIVSAGVDFIPIVSNIRGASEAIIGKDLITGEKLSVAERVLGAIPGGKQVKAGLKLFKLGDEALGAAANVNRATKIVSDFPFKSLQGKSLNWIQKQKPKNWTKEPADGNGWIWLDEKGTERMRYMRPSGENASNSKWAREENGYFRWSNEKGERLDVDGNMIPQPAKGASKQAKDDFEIKTHIPYEGVH
jgi:RHS repeat-associated protein